MKSSLHSHQIALLVLLITLVGVAVQTGVSFAHWMQMAGKLSLTVDTYALVQNSVIVYRSKIVWLEIPTFLLSIVGLAVYWRWPKPRMILGLAVISLLAIFGVWAVFIEPINVSVRTWTAASHPADWQSARLLWHEWHLVRLFLMSICTCLVMEAILWQAKNSRAY
jgi:hypothetical protein